MATQFIVNEKGEKTAVVLSSEEYENLINQPKQYELTDDYKLMTDEMLAEEENGTANIFLIKRLKTVFLN